MLPKNFFKINHQADPILINWQCMSVGITYLEKQTPPFADGFANHAQSWLIISSYVYMPNFLPFSHIIFIYDE